VRAGPPASWLSLHRGVEGGREGERVPKFLRVYGGGSRNSKKKAGEAVDAAFLECRFPTIVSDFSLSLSRSLSLSLSVMHAQCLSLPLYRRLSSPSSALASL